jgi:hypothetical protein
MAHLLDERRIAADPADFGPLNNKWQEALRQSTRNATITDLLVRLDSLLRLYRPRTFVPQCRAPTSVRPQGPGLTGLGCQFLECLVAAGTGIGVVDDHELPVCAGDDELLAPQF